MIVRATPLLAQFQEGIYPAVLERIEESAGLYGQYIKWHFMVPNAKGEAISVSGLTSTTFTPHPKCKFHTFASAIRGKPFQDSEVLNTDELLNKRCRVYLVIREIETGGSINNVERVLPEVTSEAVDEEECPL